MTNNIKQAILGHFFHAPTSDKVHSERQGLILIDEQGEILQVLKAGDDGYESNIQAARQEGKLKELAKGQYLLPGFVDLHAHAPQWPQTGKALHLPLYQWLQDNTFPLEARYADLDFAGKIYNGLVDDLLANGSTTVLYFATAHTESSLLLADICMDKGQRALVGRISMDYDCPDFYCDPTAEAGIEASAEFIEKLKSRRNNHRNLVLPVLTPRFIPACSDDILSGLGNLVKKYNCHVQSHCSESDWAHSCVLDRCGRRDANALDDFGLLTRRSVLAHCNFLNDADMSLFKARGSSVAHCPLSNFYFAGSVFPLRKALDMGVGVGLGSDISGGPNPFILDACRHAITASLALKYGVDPDQEADKRGHGGQAIDFRQAFWLVTNGGGQALDLPVGVFEKGYQFDALIVDINAPHSNVRVWDEMDSDEDIIQKIIYNAARCNIVETWVAGRLVHKI